MSTIFDLTKEQQQLLDELFWNDDDDSIKEKLENINNQIERKLEFCADLLLESKAIVEVKKTALNEAKKRLEKQLKQAERAEGRLKEFIKTSMENTGIDKIEGRFSNITLVKTKDFVFTDKFDYSKLPANCFKPQLSIEERLNKVEAKKYAKQYLSDDEDLLWYFRSSIRES